MSDSSKHIKENVAEEARGYEKSFRDRATRERKRDGKLAEKYDRVADAHRDVADYIRSRCE